MTTHKISSFMDRIVDRVTRRTGTRSEPRIYTCGTLRYTTFGLFMVFFWLLWGDFTMCLMETVLPTILPLQLKSLGAPNMVMSVFLVTVPSVMNFCINPVISFRSDRHRGPWGRRIPFLLAPTPFIALVLVAIAFAPEIGVWVHGLMSAHGSIGKNTVIIGVIGVLLVIFQFFNMFISSVYYYLFNDMVPAAYLARFMAAFRVVGTLAGMTFNYFVFPHAQTHMRFIFLGAAVLYFVGFMSMCFGLKEGKYPPPSALVGNRTGLLASFETYFRECFTHPYYLNMFAMSAFGQVAGACGFVGTLFCLHLGISLDQLGKFGTMMAIPGLLLMVPMGMLSDRIHPVRVLVGLGLFGPIMAIASFFFVHDFQSMVILTLIAFPIGQLQAAAAMPLNWLLFPKDQFGQFGSADAMARSIVTIVGSVVAGFFLDFMKKIYNGDEEYYRWMYIWSAVFASISYFFLWRVYKGWKAHGGRENYKAPSVSHSGNQASISP